MLSKLFRREPKHGALTPEQEKDIILNIPVPVMVGDEQLMMRCPPMRRWYDIMETVFAKLDSAKEDKEAIMKILLVASKQSEVDADFVRKLIPYASWFAGIFGEILERPGEWIEDNASPAQLTGLLLASMQVLDIETIVGKGMEVVGIAEHLRSAMSTPLSGASSDETPTGSSTTSPGSSSDSGPEKPNLNGDRKPERRPWEQGTPSDQSDQPGEAT